MIEEKTASQIAEELIPCTCGEVYLSRKMAAPDCPLHSSEIEEAMTLFADQEKRREAIGFAIWAADSGWLLYPDCDEDEEQSFYKPSDDFDIPDESLFGGQLYDLYLQYVNQSK